MTTLKVLQRRLMLWEGVKEDGIWVLSNSKIEWFNCRCLYYRATARTRHLVSLLKMNCQWTELLHDLKFRLHCILRKQLSVFGRKLDSLNKVRFLDVHGLLLYLTIPIYPRSGWKMAQTTPQTSEDIHKAQANQCPHEACLEVKIRATIKLSQDEL